VNHIGNKLERLELQRSIMENGNLFKLICGAGNEDVEEVYKLCYLYTLAGANAIDMSANVEVVKSAIKGVNEAELFLSEFNLINYTRPYLTVSIGMPGDHHVRKAKIIEDKCTECDACIPVCPTDAIPDILTIIESRCIGCGACGVACQDDAIGYSHKEIEIESVLKECVELGVENIELHASVIDDDPVLKEWEIVNKINSNGFNSVCVDRGYLSNHALKIRIEKMLDFCENRMIVQADGIPMSGGHDDFRTTLQAVACADIVDKFSLPVHILLSGGTNSQSIKLSQTCSVPYAGVSIGTFARHLVYEFINNPEFPEKSLLKKAVKKAKSLVDTCNA
jgi:ferredoxin